MANSKADLSAVQRQLMQVKHPELKKDIVTLGMVAKVDNGEEGIDILIKTPNNDRRLQIGLEAQVRQLISKIEGIGKVKIKFEVDQSMKMEDGNRIFGVKKVIAVGSGKGGVGKSTVTANLAAALLKSGKKVGIMDADIYGPSLGKMFGVNGRVALKSEEDKIYPLEKHGLKLISFAFLVADDQPVVWRGPMLGKAVEQFLYDVVWGELDYLLIDLPPGTGDVQLSLAQLVDLDGAIIVTTPQEVAVLDAGRAAAMFKQVKVPILGIVENMSGFACPSCGHVTDLFSKGGGGKLAEQLSVPQLGQVPLTVEVMKSGESGIPAVLVEGNKALIESYSNIVKNLEGQLALWED
ncbi:Mrp/NBP35 family ATP-binding protein [Leptospira sp. 'Mane']|uniref:Mrp/NBP35 family ATP-binding protein n=1 Tax=Leptospira sp. 'Mane' TaxID=3387407 RepID=UPI00398B38AD